MKKYLVLLACLFIAVFVATRVHADNSADPIKQIATLRQGTQLNAESNDPPVLSNASNKDVKRERAYPMQPPSIPHAIENYQIDLNANKCLSCHARTRVPESQAPMISVTHFMDRDGNFLADVSPRRYFCTQCHVTQIEGKPLINNTFVPIDQLLEKQK